MHEISLCESIIRIVEEQARTQGFSKVVCVRLEIGQLSGVELDALRFGFEVVSRHTMADGAALEILREPGLAWCLPCARNVEIEQRFSPCPICGSHQLQVTGGDQMRIKDLEVE